MDQVWVCAAVGLRESVELVVVDGAGLPTVSAASARWLRYSVNRLSSFLGGECAVDEVSPLAVAAWVDHECAQVSAVSVNSMLRGVKTVYSRLMRVGVVSSSPAAGVQFVSEPPLEPRAIDECDYLAMRAVAGCARDRALLDVLWASGCRLGGLVSMRVDRMECWQDAGRECFALLVVEKFGRTRWVYVGREQLQGDSLAEWLGERPSCRSGPWLWLSLVPPFGRLASSTIEGIVRRCRLAAGIPKERPTSAHCFRHAFAVRSLDEGIDLAAVSDWLGHSDPAFTAAFYARRNERRLREKYFGR